MIRLGRTRPFLDSHGNVLKGSIAEVAFLRIGGMDQWVMIRGESLANPPLILLSGGPGLSETSLFRHFCWPLEKHFTLVYWDQRGSGKSYDKGIPHSTMTVEQFVTDLGELVEAVCRRTGQERVAIFGHSWGSMLGCIYAHRFPDRVGAYVGSGQLGDAAEAEAASYAYAVQEATRQGNEHALKELCDIGPPPYDTKSLWTERTWLQRLAGNLSPKTMWQMGRIYVEGPESSVFDLPNLLRGFRFSLDLMWDETSNLDLFDLAPSLQMPVFLFLGRHDHWVPPETSVRYLDALIAPSKTLIWFEQSGHEPFMDEPDRFNTSMIDLVRPVLV